MKDIKKDGSKLYKLWMSKYVFWILISFVLLIFISLTFLNSLYDINDKKIKENQAMQMEQSSGLAAPK